MIRKSKRIPLKERKIRRKFARKKARVISLQLAKPIQTGAILPSVSPRYKPVVILTGKTTFDLVSLKLTKAQLRTLKKQERIAIARLKKKRR